MTAPRDRLLGVDAARAVALVGMFSTHTLPLRAPDGSESWTGLLADGRSSALFAVLAGVGVALSTPRPPDARAHLAAGAGLLVRGVLVGLLGLTLVGLDPPVAVILAYYGLLFVIAIPLLRLPAAALGFGAVLVGIGMPFLSHLLRTGLPDGPGEQAGLAALAEPGDLLVTLALTGYYPVLPWTAYLLAGMAVGRLDLRRVRVAVALLVGGGLLAAVAAAVSAVLVRDAGLDRVEMLRRQYGSTPTDTWWWLAVDIPHSGTPFDLVHTIGTALAVLGLMLLLAHVSRALVWVPAAVGAIPLTLYTLHVVLLAAYPAEGDGRGTVLLAHLAGALVIGVGLRAAGRRGPLERVVSGLGRAARDSVGERGARHRA
ncbi:heparan-alpha-glucosaminide N-acetyltransferase domain-containing protein [Pseudonocardia sp.]|uniref:heparan-alpha-glucosaminide N-acetyltransferase domain-containing protein n=1 Tax=Pseudonocardia sp. TaxID=60912 RepID=UPI00260B0586|nr:heparan-alpha-glucosaminide N-acetyltransferase domain-containing protein [Pseudonocardia sp.]